MEYGSIVFGCSRCYSRDLYVSRPRTMFEKHVLPLVLLRPVRCSHCMKRSYRPVFVQAKPRPEPPQVAQRAAAA